MKNVSSKKSRYSQDRVRNVRNKIFVRFNTKLSNQLLNVLIEDIKFTGKFMAFDIIKFNDNVVGMHIIDKEKVNYSVTSDGIEAFSLHYKDKIVRKIAEIFTEDLLIMVGRNKNEYIIDDTAKHNFLQNFDTNALLNTDISKKLIKIFEDKGFDRPIIQSIRILIEKKGEPIGNVQIYYPDSDSYKNKTVLIEAHEKLLRDITEAVKNE